MSVIIKQDARISDILNNGSGFLDKIIISEIRIKPSTNK